MSYADQLAPYSAAHIIAATGCPRGTAYDWKNGRREPPAWQQPHWLAIIASGARKRHNKTSLATDTSREAGSRKRKS